ncbi:MAG TPA: C39 family peptidase, partial [bacterium]|nr:C39 family peptidase [bacterium]
GCDGGKSGSFTSDEIKLDFPCNELILSWNAFAPAGSSLEAEFGVKRESAEWSGWFQLGEWTPDNIRPLFRRDPEYGELHIDHFKSSIHFGYVRYRIKLNVLRGARTPVLRTVFLSASDTTAASDEKDVYPTVVTDIAVPFISQHDAAAVKNSGMISAGCCAPTSVAMVLNYYGIPVSVETIGLRAYDHYDGIFGNWVYLAAAASEFGLEASVRRFSSWRDVEKLLKDTIPVIISVSYGKGDLTPKPNRESRGHLIVVRGFTESGDVICNDPDGGENVSGEGLVYDRDELGRAFFGHGGVGIVITGND